MKAQHILTVLVLSFSSYTHAGNSTGDLATHLSTIDQFEQKMRENRVLLEAKKFSASETVKPNLDGNSTLSFRADGFIIAEKYYREGPYIKFCEAPYASTDGRVCAALDPATKKVMKHLTYTAQEFLDVTFGLGVTQFTSLGWKDDGAIIYYTIIQKS